MGAVSRCGRRGDGNRDRRLQLPAGGGRGATIGRVNQILGGQCGFRHELDEGWSSMRRGAETQLQESEYTDAHSEQPQAQPEWISRCLGIRHRFRNLARFDRTEEGSG